MTENIHSLGLRPGVDIPSKRDMTEPEARRCVIRINEHVQNALDLVLELRDRKGWKALGYPSWIDCAVAEFGKSKSRVYQLVQAAQIQLELHPFSTNVESLPEAHLRPLAALDTPEEKRDALEQWEDRLREIVRVSTEGVRHD